MIEFDEHVALAIVIGMTVLACLVSLLHNER